MTRAFTDSTSVSVIVGYAEQLELNIKMLEIDCESQALADSLEIDMLRDRIKKSEPTLLDKVMSDGRVWFIVGAVVGMQSRKW